jgi:DHA1 family bicyclomycin/chloramphenicol resistance-like MFS transporter
MGFPEFVLVLLARVLQGLGTSATRVIATSIVRDCYDGRRMASVMSLAMMVFIAVPIIAPSLGQAVMLLTQWRGIFIVLMLYGVLALIWSGLRMLETLPVSERKSLAIRDVLGAFRQTVTNRQTPLGYALAAGGVQGALFAFVFSSQQCSLRSTDSGITFRWRSQRSPSASPSLAFSMPASLAGLACG